ncbi:MAG: surface carbohydrate biosynthesis protein [Candidatus Thermoplasmatota archaeon]
MLKDKAKQFHIYLPIETKGREYLSKLYLTTHLAREKYDVVIGERGQLYKLSPFLKPGVFIEKSIGFTGLNKFKKLKSLGNCILAWDEEGLVFHPEVYKFSLRDELIKLCDVFFAWGENHKKVLEKYFRGKDVDLILCGNPRVDIIPYLKPRKDVEKPMILFNDNFGPYNHYHGYDHYKKRIETYVYGRPNKSEIDKEKVEKIIMEEVKIKKILFNIFIDAIRKTSKFFPDANIVVRPHPSSNVDTIQERLNDLENVKVCNEDTVEKWILASDAVVHSGCTTGLQAFMLNKPVFALIDDNHLNPSETLPNLVSDKVKDIDILIKKLESAIEGTYNPECDDLSRHEKIQILQKHIYGIKENQDGKITGRACKIITDYITKNYKSKRSSDSISPTVYFNRLKYFFLLPKILIQLNRIKKNSYRRQKFPGITISEIKKDLSKFSNKKYKVKKMYNDVFQISSME